MQQCVAVLPCQMGMEIYEKNISVWLCRLLNIQRSVKKVWRRMRQTSVHGCDALLSRQADEYEACSSVLLYCPVKQV